MAGRSIEKISLDVFIGGIFVDVVDIDLKKMIAKTMKKTVKLGDEEVKVLLNLFDRLGVFEEVEEEE